MNLNTKEMLERLAARECWCDNEDFQADSYSGENFDDAYHGGYSDGETELARALLGQRAAGPSLSPIETAPEGVHILLWFPHGEAGRGGYEAATIYRNEDGGMSFWTHGGPNSGSDWEPCEAPTYWTHLPFGAPMINELRLKILHQGAPVIDVGSTRIVKQCEGLIAAEIDMVSKWCIIGSIGQLEFSICTTGISQNLKEDKDDINRTLIQIEEFDSRKWEIFAMECCSHTIRLVLLKKEKC